MEPNLGIKKSSPIYNNDGEVHVHGYLDLLKVSALLFDQSYCPILATCET